MSHVVEVSLTVGISSPNTAAAVAALSGGHGGDERDQIEAAGRAGISELVKIADRYGFSISDATVRVRE